MSNHQFHIWWGYSAFFFGDKSKLPKYLAELIELIALHCITFEAQHINDHKTFTKFGYQVDTRVFRWLQQCEMNSDREKVDGMLINFKPLINAVLNDQFYQQLPKTFKSGDNENDPLHIPGLRPRKRLRLERNQE